MRQTASSPKATGERNHGLPNQQDSRRRKSSGLMNSGALAGITGMPNLYGESAGIRTQDPRLKRASSLVAIASYAVRLVA